jgi:chromosome segregation protein
VNFSKLRITGFKSFVEPTEVSIEPGITGVVGPNGCGKSNIVEALRWVMGETSAKQLRGGGMDDVIFNGTTDRPARNIAEVVLSLDNEDRNAPGPFNDSEEIEISRRIERGAGSTYRINGREVRARDVQLLFADLTVGAHSPAIVSQGRVGAIIGAKPTERRTLLEEAAGIIGLHSRRHEAELRLRAAETNLERLEDVVAAMQAQYDGLRRQARQATRYRKMSEELRQLEAILLHQRWTDASAARDAARDRLREADSATAERTRIAGESATRQANAASAVPGLRETEVIAAAELQRLTMARRELEAEEGRIQESLDETERQFAQIAADIERETSLSTDAKAALGRLEQERDDIAAGGEGEASALSEAEAALAEAREALETGERALEGLTEQAATAEARKDGLEQQSAELTQRAERLRARAAEVDAERREATETLPEAGALDAAAQGLSEAEAALTKARSDLETSEATRGGAEQAESEARTAAQDAEAHRAKLHAEAQALAEVLETATTDLFPPLIDALRVEPGYETALGAALGEDLTAPLDTAANIHWAALSPLGSPPAAPDNAEPFERFVSGPDVIRRRLQFISVVENNAAGDALAKTLQPGQRIVSKDGALWRWDGYTVRAGTPTAAAKRLRQRNRLAELEAQIAAATAKKESTDQRLNEVKAAVERAVAAERVARAAVDKAYNNLNTAREAHGALSHALANTQSRVTTLTETAGQIRADLTETEEERTTASDALAAFEDPVRARERIETLRMEVGELRRIAADRHGAFDSLRRQAEDQRRRLSTIAEEDDSWRQRAEGAESRLAHLMERQEDATRRKESLQSRPHEIEEQRNRLLDAIELAETGRGNAADRLAEGESALVEADKMLRAAEAALAEAREVRIRAEAQVEQAEGECRTVSERISERLDCAPHDILREAKIEASDALPSREDTEQKIEQLTRRRDAMGPVNLRAEGELAELEEKIETMQTEREDLLAAIARLRQGISSLNREGRERLLAAFEQVNAHFQDLFVRLFGGGRAHLALTEADDPLEAGLEIMASPPGKKLQVMSLLSGGEQAMTAVALLFAVFLTNPAPICILDEVDAPLDDANVDRFCTLLDEIAHSGQTRFLCVTHHRMTMARMDRLFGVTMGERGVSQLVSVDLGQAEELRQTA